VSLQRRFQAENPQSSNLFFSSNNDRKANTFYKTGNFSNYSTIKTPRDSQSPTDAKTVEERYASENR
jgi:hypothetical protein